MSSDMIDVDLEAQQVVQATPHTEVEGAKTHEMYNLAHHTSSVASSLRSPVSTGQDIGNEAQSVVVSQAEGSDISEINIDQSRSRDDVSHTTSDRLTQNRFEGLHAVVVPRTPSVDLEDPRMIGDFDGSANQFWKLYRDEAKSHDDARINTLKEGMDSALIFAGLFSAVLTGFVVDSKQNLKPSPADETVYYLRQHSTILSQISIQLSSITPQVTIPSTPPPPFPQFSPLASDIRVNTFWSMALAFSLLAALLAILIQQWVRNYMHVFQRYSDPLKSSRFRQYLYEGCEGWYMPMVADAVPSCLHVSLFLFLIGLGDSLLNINTVVGISTIVPISIFGLLYISTTFVPIIYPQAPYQNSFSGILWYLFQKLRGRRFRDRGPDGKIKPVSAKMAQGQMQLAMEKKEERRDRDVRAIRWLINNLTEDAEMEQFMAAIPGSFDTDWGREVWKRVGKHDESEGQRQDKPFARPRRDTTAHQPSSCWSIGSVLRPIIHLVRNPTPRHPPTDSDASTHSPEENAVYELSTRIARSVEKCKNRKLSSNNDGPWQKRTRACIEVTALLVFRANARLAWFGDISKLLGIIGSFEKIREMSVVGTDQFFVTHWTCLSLLAIRSMLVDHWSMWLPADTAIRMFEDEDDTGNHDALETVQKIDKTLLKASNCLNRLYKALHKTEDLQEVKEILGGHESEISKLEQLKIEVDRIEKADDRILYIQACLNDKSHRIISQFPGVLDDFDSDAEVPLYGFLPQNRAPIPFSRLVELSLDRRKLQFICPGETLKSMCSPSVTLRKILEGQGDADAYKELLKNLEIFTWQGDEMQRQLWRLQDLSQGGLGFRVELFFLALKQLLSTSSKGSHSALYARTFRAITSDWSDHKCSLGTQKLLIYIAKSHFGELVGSDYPSCIVDEFLLLLANIFEGQTGPHIDRARRQFENCQWLGKFREGVLMALSGWGAQQFWSLASSLSS